MNYTIEWKNSGVFIKFSGKLSDNLINHVNGLIIGHASFDSLKYQVWDFFEVEEFQINSEQGKITGVLDKAAAIWNKKMKVAVITINPNLIEYTKNYIYEIRDIEWECKIFDNRSEADKWSVE